MNSKVLINILISITILQCVSLLSLGVDAQTKEFINTSIKNLKEIKQKCDNIEWYYKKVQYTLSTASIGGKLPVALSYWGVAIAPAILPIASTIGTAGLISSGVWMYYVDRENTKLLNMVNLELDKLLAKLRSVIRNGDLYSSIKDMREQLIKGDPNTKLAVEGFMLKLTFYSPELAIQFERIFSKSQKVNEFIADCKDLLQKWFPKLGSIDPTLTIPVTIFLEMIEFSDIHNSKSELSDRVQEFIENLERLKQHVVKGE